MRVLFFWRQTGLLDWKVPSSLETFSYSSFSRKKSFSSSSSTFLKQKVSQQEGKDSTVREAKSRQTEPPIGLQEDSLCGILFRVRSHYGTKTSLGDWGDAIAWVIYTWLSHIVSPCLYEKSFAFYTLYCTLYYFLPLLPWQEQPWSPSAISGPPVRPEDHRSTAPHLRQTRHADQQDRWVELSAGKSERDHCCTIEYLSAHFLWGTFFQWLTTTISKQLALLMPHRSTVPFLQLSVTFRLSY